jgi:hypothetical protein
MLCQVGAGGASGVVYASEEEHGLAPANYPWSHEGPFSCFDASR